MFAVSYSAALTSPAAAAEEITSISLSEPSAVNTMADIALRVRPKVETPQAALELLKVGNSRFFNGQVDTEAFPQTTEGRK